MKQRPKLVLLDANALLHRAWHAIPPLSAPDGTVVNAAYGMASVSLKIRKEEKPDLFIACWDTAAPTFRHEAFKEYKAQRKEKEQELYDQIPIAKEVLETLGIPSVSLDGYEADDLLGTLARIGKKNGYHVRIVTGDRDSLQLIDDDVDVLTFKKGVSVTHLYDAEEVKKEYGITPEQMIQWKAIRGDSSDNIPGIHGIGEKGATELIQTYDTLENAIRAAKDKNSDLPAGLRKKLIDGAEQGMKALELVAIDCEVPIKRDLASFASAPDREAFIRVAGTYGFRSLIPRFDDGTGAGNIERASEHSKKREKAHLDISSEKEAGIAIKEMADAREIVIDMIAGEQGSLFGSSLVGMLIASKDRSILIAEPLLRVKSVHRDLDSLLSEEKSAKICHDAKTVMRLLESYDLRLANIAHDTLIAAYLLAAGERQTDLDLIALQELGIELPKGSARPAAIGPAVFGVAERQRKALAESGLDTIMQRFELPLIPVLREMERNGILLDLPYLKSLSNDIGNERDRIEKDMFKLAGHEFNPASPSQLAHILFDELHLSAKGIKRGKTGFSTAASELEKLEGMHPIVELISQHREVSKLLSTYVDVLPTLVDAEGRIHTTLNQAVTATGRLSSSDPNLQNIPIRTELGRKIRRVFIAEKGMRLVSCDYSQIELRVVAALSKDKKMLDAFRSGADIHTATAAEIWEIDPAKVTKEQRRAAKAINFGILYGQGPNGLARSAGIPFADAKEFIEKYFKTYHGIKTYLEETKLMARANGFVETLFGRRRPIPDIVSGIPAVRAAAERMAINMPAQGTSADLIKLAMIEISKGLNRVSKPARLLMQVHDELLLEVPEKDVEAVAGYVKKTMENIEDVGCPIVVDAKVGKNWGEMTTL